MYIYCDTETLSSFLILKSVISFDEITDPTSFFFKQQEALLFWFLLKTETATHANYSLSLHALQNSTFATLRKAVTFTVLGLKKRAGCWKRF